MERSITLSTYFFLSPSCKRLALRAFSEEQLPKYLAKKLRTIPEGLRQSLGEQVRLVGVLTGDLALLITPFEIAVNAGLRKDELVSIKAEHINLSGVPAFCEGLEILPNWLLLIDSKTRDLRQVPMNRIVRDVCAKRCRAQSLTS